MVYIRQLKKYKKYVPKRLIQSKKKSKKWTKNFRNNLTNTMWNSIRLHSFKNNYINLS